MHACRRTRRERTRSSIPERPRHRPQPPSVAPPRAPPGAAGRARRPCRAAARPTQERRLQRPRWRRGGWPGKAPKAREQRPRRGTLALAPQLLRRGGSGGGEQRGRNSQVHERVSQCVLQAAQRAVVFRQAVAAGHAHTGPATASLSHASGASSGRTAAAAAATAAASASARSPAAPSSAWRARASCKRSPGFGAVSHRTHAQIKTQTLTRTAPRQ
jgi:hypothetical protein